MNIDHLHGIASVPGEDFVTILSQFEDPMPESAAPIRGTYIFDGPTAALGHELNKMVASLSKCENRDAFARNEDAYVGRYGLTPEQRVAFKARDWLRLIQLGGNIYYIYKLTAIEHLKMSEVGAVQAGMSHDEFLATLARRAAV
jgi:protocatechuate 4,5-dioxygenase alpha chain